MILNDQNVNALQQGFNAAFMQGLGSAAPTWNQVAMRIPSTTKAENYGWMKDLPGMREWIGRRQINNLSGAVAQLVNKHWEHTIGVDRDDFEDDQLGIYTTQVQMQGEIASTQPDEMVWTLLPKGFTVAGFDGQPFFDADHAGYNTSGNEVSWSNVQTGSGSPWFLMDLSRSFMKPLIFQDRQAPRYAMLNRPTDWNNFMDRELLFGVDSRNISGFGFHQLAFGSKADLDATNFQAARLALATQHRPDGSKLPVKATHLVVGESNRAAAEALLLKEFLTGGESNTNYKAVELIVNPWLD